jgi:anti-sigma B factor antagonist
MSPEVLMSLSPAIDVVSAASDAGYFTVEVLEEAGETVARVSGEIDIATCQGLRDAIEPHLGAGQRVVLDLSGVTFMDSSCLRVLLDAHTTLSGDGGSLIVRNPSSVARRLLSVPGIAELFAAQGHRSGGTPNDGISLRR